jgi:hypothetical protein
MATTRKWEWAERDGRKVRRYFCKPGEYPWDDWYCAARAAGVDTELALLGSIVMRSADQQSWEEALQAECGWSDEGAAMLELAKRDPAAAHARWQELVDADKARKRQPSARSDR